MNIYQKISITLGLLAFIPLCVQILRGTPQNLATFILWGILDFTNGASMLAKGSSNYQLPFAYALGSVFVCLCILKKSTVAWTRFETFVSFLVGVSWAGWVLSGPYYANVFASIGMALATLPQLKDTWRKPEDLPVVVYALYLIANTLSTYSGLSWTVEERLYPFVCAVICALVMAASLRRYVPFEIETR